MARRSQSSNVPRWIRYPLGLLAAAIVGPAVVGMLMTVFALAAPLMVPALPFIVWGLGHSGTREAPPRRIPPRHQPFRHPILQPT